ncbi:protein SMG5 isoform X2 [Zootermopsis nevadensis]|uniref:protein SMG5 isoform X2 n=1 Tax=Zootermopsis nevadensis TaxID=136037 RepID=UPI000B8E60E7|nr:protein SMG5 isoform X2 [Zootermopsis nevadensis]
MKKSYNPISDVRNENVELSRRLYRAISDASRHLDDRRGRAQTCNDLFLPNVETQRVKLREYCERLIFSDPVGYGRKGEELLWRKGYYDVVTTAKRLRKNNTWSPQEVAHMQSHLAAGVGHYHHLLFRLQIEFKLDLYGLVDFPLILYDEGLKKDKASSSSKALESNCVDWAKQAVHRCLVYLGDLSRYFLDLHPHWDTGLAVRYYLQALNMNVDVGMPHNQLGTLSGTCNYGLDAAYYYMRCLMCKQPFEGAEGNLERLLEKSTQWLEQHCDNQYQVEDALSVQPAERIHRLIARFLLLTDVWFFDRKSLVESNQVCHQLLLDLQHCMALPKPFAGGSKCEMKGGQLDEEHLSLFQRSEENQERPEYLGDDLIFKMVVMSLLCITKLQTSGSQQASAVVGFILAMFSQLVQQVIHRIQDSVFDISFPSFALPPTTTATSLELNLTALSPGDCNIKIPSDGMAVIRQPSDQSAACESTVALVNGRAGENDCQDTKAVMKKKISKRLQRLRSRRRRRRRLNSSEDSDLSDGDFPYGDGTSSSDDGNSNISESTELDLDLSSDVEEDDDEEDEGDQSPKMLHINSDSSKVAVKRGKTLDQDATKDELNKCNGLKSGKKGDRNLASPLINTNGSVKDEGSCRDSVMISGGSLNNFEAVAIKEINAEDKDVDKNRMKNGQVLDPADAIEFVAGERLLHAIKVCADWLRGDGDAIRACGRESQTLLSRFVTLLNLINVNADAFEKGSDVDQLFKLKNIAEIFRKVPLPEDVTLKGLSSLKTSHAAIDWEYLRHHCLLVNEEALLRVYKLVDFGHFVASVPDTGVSYNSEQKLFAFVGETGRVPGEISKDKIKETATANIRVRWWGKW